MDLLGPQSGPFIYESIYGERSMHTMLSDPLFRARVRNLDTMFHTDITFYRKLSDGSVRVLSPVEVTEVEYVEGTVVQPTLRIEDETAQDLMNQLWKAGFRPTGMSVKMYID